MEDQSIISLYWSRSEDAISQTDKKYGAYFFAIAYNILANREDAEESVNDTYLAAWNALPPQKPKILASFLGKVTRNISINRWKSYTAQKRGGGELTVALEELEDCVDETTEIESAIAYREMISSFNRFLDQIPKIERDVFMRRYWFLDPIAEIADSFGFSQSKVTTMLYRTRQKLRKHFETENML